MMLGDFFGLVETFVYFSKGTFGRVDGWFGNRLMPVRFQNAVGFHRLSVVPV